MQSFLILYQKIFLFLNYFGLFSSSVPTTPTRDETLFCLRPCFEIKRSGACVTKRKEEQK